MSDERSLNAIRRIEQALARIEAAAGRPTAAPNDDGEFTRLRDAHRRLRERVQGAIEEIDRLLEDAS
jgi:hypothetical protein